MMGEFIMISAKKNVIADPTLIYFFGDSITDGYGATNDSYRYSTLVANYFSLTEINDGLPQSCLQSTTATVLDGIDRYDGINNYPRNQVVLILYGINDCIHMDTYGCTISQYQTDMETILDSILQKKIADRVFVCTLTPNSNITGDEITLRDDINTYIRSLVASHGVSIIDLDIALSAYTWGDISDDGTHPNDDGHAYIAAAVENVISAKLGI